MSNYERNNTMVACILGVIIVSAVGIAAVAYFANTNWNPSWNNEQLTYSFDATVGSSSDTVELVVDVGTGSIDIEFENNASLLYRIDITTTNNSVEQYGEPTVVSTFGEIRYIYETGSASITLGSGVNYTFDVETGTGSIDANFGLGAHVGNVSLQTSTGSIDFAMSSTAVLVGNVDVDLRTSTGSVDVDVTLPASIGASIEASTSTGSVTISALGWTQITPNHYETSDYDTAAQTMTLIAVTSTGSVTAVFL
ncbi:MAG: LiaF domain-containing protein [Candidatus Thorarchaeota archaeon]|jgi:hypothetical protein